MSDRILFQRDRLTVSDSKITIGDATVYYPSVSATRIYEGRPLLNVAFAGIAGLVPLVIFGVTGARLFGQFFPAKALAILVVPMLAMIVLGFSYRVKCLFLGVDGSSIAILKSAERYDLETAQRVIEEAKRAYDASGKKA